MLETDKLDTVRRIAHAHKIGAEEQLIADATVVDGTLLVSNCAGSTIKVPFEAVPALTKIPKEQMANFTIEKYGDRISWLGDTIELNYESLRYHVDEDYRKSVDRSILLETKNYGVGIKLLRGSRNIRQSDIPGYDERQIGRIERGEQKISSKALAALAKAHGLSVSSYIRAVAEMVARSSKK